jgi:hypothetical protein
MNPYWSDLAICSLSAIALLWLGTRKQKRNRYRTHRDALGDPHPSCKRDYAA